MSADGFLPTAEVDLSLAVMDALRMDADVQSVLGQPARLFDNETRGAPYPYAYLERHEQRSVGASLVCGQEHRLTIATYSRHDGLSEAKSLLGALRKAVEAMQVNLTGQRVVLSHVIYNDAMRTRDRRVHRGLLRIRIITEEA